MTKGLNALTQGTFVIQTQTSVIYIFVETKTRKRKAVSQTPTSVIYIFVETKTRKRKAIKLRATEKERKFYLIPTTAAVSLSLTSRSYSRGNQIIMMTTELDFN
jgi:hypothetical protein